MRIDTDFAASLPASGNTAPTPASGDDFATLLKQASGSQRSAGTKPAAPAAETAEQRERKKAEAVRVAHEALAKELHDYLNKTPAEHLREAVLKEMGVTEEELAAMPPAKRQAAEAEINQRIKERLIGKKTGSADDTAAPLGIDPAPGAPAAENTTLSGFDRAAGIFQSINAGQVPT